MPLDPVGSSQEEVRRPAEDRLREPTLYRVITLSSTAVHHNGFRRERHRHRLPQAAAEATKIMLDVHKKGMGVVGVYTFDIASTKVSQVHEMARQSEFPLRASVEEA